MKNAACLSDESKGVMGNMTGDLRLASKASVLIIIVLLLGAAAYYAYWHSGQNKALPEDVSVEAVLKRSANPHVKDYPYVVELSIRHSKPMSNMIYPYIPGLGPISFDNAEAGEYAVPGSIGLYSDDETLVRQALRDEAHIDAPNKQPIAGFNSPTEAGQYKMRVYFQASPGFDPKNDMVLVYVHHERGRFGQDLRWTKLIKVKAER
jgi:hypothetical protein